MSTSSHGPYDYMSQHQQNYTSLNPLNSANVKKTAPNMTAETSLTFSNNTNSKMPAKMASTDAAYESFMKEIGKLL